MALAELQKARTQLDEADKFLRSSAKDTIEGLVADLFKNHPDIQTLEWAQRGSEYNDEGMYPGVFGPVINDERDPDKWYIEWIYESGETDKRVKDLRDAFDIIGDEILADIYGDQDLVTVKRHEDGILITTEYVGT